MRGCKIILYVLKQGAAFFELGLPVAIRCFAAYYVCVQPSMSFSSAEAVPTLPVLIASLSLYVRQDRCVSLSLALQARSIIYGELSLSLVVVPRPPNSLISASLVEPS